MGNIKDLERKIKEGKNIDEELPMYMNLCASHNYRYAGMEFAMQYYDLYEGIADGHIKYAEGAKEAVSELNDIINKSLLSGFDAEVREECIKRTDELRNRIIERMQVITAYTDKFAIYEYILNRLEFKFYENIEHIDNDKEAARIVNYIFGVKDNVTVNSRIKEIVGQLPVRITREKFYELLDTALSVYEGSQTSGVEDFVYMVRSAAGLYEPDGIDTMFIELKEKYEQLNKFDYRDIDEKSYNRLMDILKDAVEEITQAADCYYLVTCVVNALYAVLLNLPYASTESSDFVEKLLPVVKSANELFSKDDMSGIPGDIVEKFADTEGELEKSIENVSRQQAVLEEITVSYKERVKSMMLGELYECLTVSSKLLSNSSFAALYDENKNEIVADKAYLAQKSRELCEEFAARLKSQQQVVNRAMIAAALKELPVFFSTHDEVTGYIKNSLSGCHDEAEKQACISIINSITGEV